MTGRILFFCGFDYYLSETGTYVLVKHNLTTYKMFHFYFIYLFAYKSVYKWNHNCVITPK